MVLLLTITFGILFGWLSIHLISEQVTTTSGAICGSVWHFRPGGGAVNGGQRDHLELAHDTSNCRNAARFRLEMGVAAGILAVLILGSATAMLGYQVFRAG